MNTRPAAREFDAIENGRSFDQEIIPVNLRRTQVVGSVAAAMMMVEAALGVVRGNMPLTATALAGAAFMLAFVVAAYFVRRRAVPMRALPHAFIVVLLLFAQMLAVTGAAPNEQVYGYSITLIGLSALFKVRPRVFLAIVATTSLALLSWIASLRLSPGDALQSAGTLMFASVTAMLIRDLLYRARRRDHLLRTIIAEQNKGLSKANQELAQRNLEVRETMAIAAHDLRSPMSGLHGLLELAASRPDMPPDMLRTVFTEAGQSVADMLALVEKLLQAHEAEDCGTAELRPCDLQSLVEAAVERIRVSAGMLGVEVRRADGAPILVSTSDEAVAQILDNLLSNAIRYSPRGGVVRVACGIAGGPMIEVIDHGVGVAPEEQTAIFAKFQRGSRLPVAGNVGTGLGLYIAQRAALSISARLDHRPKPGGGSIFRLTFPASSKDDG